MVVVNLRGRENPPPQAVCQRVHGVNGGQALPLRGLQTGIQYLRPGGDVIFHRHVVGLIRHDQRDPDFHHLPRGGFGERLRRGVLARRIVAALHAEALRERRQFRHGEQGVEIDAVVQLPRPRPAANDQGVGGVGIQIGEGRHGAHGIELGVPGGLPGEERRAVQRGGEIEIPRQFARAAHHLGQRQHAPGSLIGAAPGVPPPGGHQVTDGVRQQGGGRLTLRQGVNYRRRGLRVRPQVDPVAAVRLPVRARRRADGRALQIGEQDVALGAALRVNERQESLRSGAEARPQGVERIPHRGSLLPVGTQGKERHRHPVERPVVHSRGGHRQRSRQEIRRPLEGIRGDIRAGLLRLRQAEEDVSGDVGVGFPALRPPAPTAVLALCPQQAGKPLLQGALQTRLQVGGLQTESLYRAVGGQVGQEARKSLLDALVRIVLQRVQGVQHVRRQRGRDLHLQIAARGGESARQADYLQHRVLLRKHPARPVSLRSGVAHDGQIAPRGFGSVAPAPPLRGEDRLQRVGLLHRPPPINAGAPAGFQRKALHRLGGVVQRERGGLQLHRDLQSLLRVVVDDGRQREVVAQGDEARRHGAHQERLGDGHFGLRLPHQAVAGHTAGVQHPGGQVIGEGEPHQGFAVGVGHDFALPKGRIGELLTHGRRDSLSPAAAQPARLLHAAQGVGRQPNPRADAEGLLSVEGLLDGLTVGVGQRQGGLIHRSQRKSALHGVAIRIGDVQAQGDFGPRGGLVGQVEHLHFQDEMLRLHVQVERPVAEIGMPVAALPRQGQGEVDVGGILLPQGDFQRAAARGYHPHLVAVDASPLQRQQSRRLRAKGVGHKDLRRLAGAVGFLVGAQEQALIGERRPHAAAAAPHPEEHLGQRAPLAAQRNLVRAAFVGREGHPSLALPVGGDLRFGHRGEDFFVSGETVLVRGGMLFPGNPAELDGERTLPKRLALPIDGTHLEGPLVPRGRDPLFPAHPDVKRRRMETPRSAGAHREAALIGSGNLQNVAFERLPLREGHLHPEAAIRIGDGFPRGDGFRSRAEQPPRVGVKPGHIQRADGVPRQREPLRLQREAPLDGQTAGGRAEVVSGFHLGSQGLAALQIFALRLHLQIEFRLAVLRHLEGKAGIGIFDLQGVVAGSGVLRQGVRSAGRAEIGQRQGEALHLLILIVAHQNGDRIESGQGVTPVEILPRHEAEMHRLAGAVDGTVGVEVGVEIGRGVGGGDVAVPGQQTAVHRGERRREVRLPRLPHHRQDGIVSIVGIPSLSVKEALAVGLSLGDERPGGVVKAHGRAGDGLAAIQVGRPHQGVPPPVLEGQVDVGEYHQGGAVPRSEGGSGYGAGLYPARRSRSCCRWSDGNVVHAGSIARKGQSARRHPVGGRVQAHFGAPQAGGAVLVQGVVVVAGRQLDEGIQRDGGALHGDGIHVGGLHRHSAVGEGRHEDIAPDHRRPQAHLRLQGGHGERERGRAAQPPAPGVRQVGGDGEGVIGQGLEIAVHDEARAAPPVAPGDAGDVGGRLQAQEAARVCFIVRRQGGGEADIQGIAGTEEHILKAEDLQLGVSDPIGAVFAPQGRAAGALRFPADTQGIARPPPQQGLGAQSQGGEGLVPLGLQGGRALPFQAQGGLHTGGVHRLVEGHREGGVQR